MKVQDIFGSFSGFHRVAYMVSIGIGMILLLVPPLVFAGCWIQDPVAILYVNLPQIGHHMIIIVVLGTHKKLKIYLGRQN